MSDNGTKMIEPMSKEEMIDTLKGLVFNSFDRTTAKEREALDTVIKISEQEPCYDAVSREEVKEILNKRGQKAVMTFDHFIKLLDYLPPVTPARKKGRWIETKRPNGLIGFKCSRCGNFYPLPDGLNFCPNCGAEMEVEQWKL